MGSCSVIPSHVARNYKEAGRLNEKLKTLVTEETSLATEVETLLAELEETSLKLDEAKRELSITEQKRSKEEESSGGWNLPG